MNNPNPFVPKGSLLEQQSQRRSRLKLAVFCVLAVSVTGLTAMLIQGCKREKPDIDLNPPALATNDVPMDATNPPLNSVSNPPVVIPPPTNPPVVLPPVVDAAPVGGSEYVVAKGDSLSKIAKLKGVTLKALKAANPTVVAEKLKVGQKLVIPVGVKPAASGTETAPVNSVGAVADGGQSYTVKSGDTLTKIAKATGVGFKAIQAANGLTTTKIKVGQKLKIPVKGEAAPAAAAPAAPAPVVEPVSSAPALPPVTAPAPVRAPGK